MKHSGVVNLNRSKIVNTIVKNNVIILLTVFFVVGIIIGVITLRNNEIISNIAKANFNNFVLIRKNGNFGNIFLSSFFDILPFALLVFLCGTSIVGIALTPIAIAYRGFNYGILAAYLYNTYSLQGIAFNSLILIPTTLIAVFGFLISGRSALNFSVYLAKISLPKGQAVCIYNDFRIYCKKALLFLLFYIASALLDAIMSMSFIDYFKF
ncbi:MAG: hypothetical protein E7531_06410 [Ruminococcaceae bacterium]|nr:hypothetical protein [Oscillospiraceae bacterium]